MRVRVITTSFIAIASLSLWPAQGVAQSDGIAIPRTAEGRPDLTAVWDFRTVTPLERPTALADKEFLTEEEAAEFAQQSVLARNADLNREDTVTDRAVVNGTTETADLRLAYNDFWWDRGTQVVGTRRTSLIIDPPNGRVPPLTPAEEQRRAARALRSQRLAEGPEDRSLAERCITGFNSGPPMLPGGYNQNVQLFQTPSHVVILNEMVHNARIVPLDGRPHTALRQWTGESRGRWVGDTLVVETKNFRQETSFNGSSERLHLIEHFTRIDRDTLIYEFTVSDPSTWTRPWTVQIPMRRSEFPIYEYSCHEGNYGMEGTLSGARSVEVTGTAAPVTVR